MGNLVRFDASLREAAAAEGYSVSGWTSLNSTNSSSGWGSSCFSSGSAVEQARQVFAEDRAAFLVDQSQTSALVAKTDVASEQMEPSLVRPLAAPRSEMTLLSPSQLRPCRAIFQVREPEQVSLLPTEAPFSSPSSFRSSNVSDAVGRVLQSGTSTQLPSSHGSLAPASGKVLEGSHAIERLSSASLQPHQEPLGKTQALGFLAQRLSAHQPDSTYRQPGEQLKLRPG